MRSRLFTFLVNNATHLCIFVTSEESNLILVSSNVLTNRLVKTFIYQRTAYHTQFPVSHELTIAFASMPFIETFIYEVGQVWFLRISSFTQGFCAVPLYPAVCGSRINLIFVLPRYHPHLVLFIPYSVNFTTFNGFIQYFFLYWLFF